MTGSLRRPLAATLCLALAAIAAHGEDPRPGRLRIGLALGGGSAKGMAHAGVLQWLEEHRVPVDAIAGTSSGAFVGGAYATGMSAAELQELLRSADWTRILRPDIPYPLKAFRRKADDREYRIRIEAGLRHGFRLQSGLNSGIGVGLFLSRIAFPYSAVLNLDDLPIPFRPVATDLEKGETIVLDQGPLGPAIRASMALPGTFDPVRIRGRLLSDGGILDNVPADVVRAMGVDVVIAVSIGRPEPGRPPETFTAVANRAIDLMMEALAEQKLLHADIVLRPEVEGFAKSDFLESDALAARGYAAAAGQADRLLRYALDPAAWAAHQARVQARRRPPPEALAFAEVTGVSAAAAVQIALQLEPQLHRAPDLAAIESDLDAVIGFGRYASAMYDRRARGEQTGLGVEIRDKSYGPPFVRFALDLDNDDRDVNLSMGARVTLMDLPGQGSEWRFDGGLGSTLRLATELFQPIGGHGPARRGAFLAPRAFYLRSSENLHAAAMLSAIYSRERVGVGFDLGWIHGRTTELRAGFEVAHLRNLPRGGAPLPRSAGPERALRVRFEFDGQDRACFPSHGVRFTSTGAWILAAPETAGPYGTVAGSLSVAWTHGPRHHIALQTEAGASFSGTPPLLDQFSLGGPFRLGAFAPEAFRGSRFVLVGATYRTPLARLPPLLGDHLCLIGRLDAGSAFETRRAAHLESSLTAGLAVDTLLGPFFVGASASPGGTLRAYIVVGSQVR